MRKAPDLLSMVDAEICECQGFAVSPGARVRVGVIDSAQSAGCTRDSASWPAVIDNGPVATYYAKPREVCKIVA